MISRSIIRVPNRCCYPQSSASVAAAAATSTSSLSRRNTTQLAACSNGGSACERRDYLAAPRTGLLLSHTIPRHQHQAYAVAQHLRRPFHSSSHLCGEEGKEMSEKERKKMMKAKAKAAQAEKEKEKEEAEAAKESADPPGPPAGEQEPKKDEAPPPSKDTASPASAATAAGAGESPYTPPYDENGVRQYSYPELTEDAAKHKAGLSDPERPFYQNPLHHNNPEHDGSKMFPEDFATQEEFEAAITPLPPFDDKSGRVVAPEHIHELADEMVNLTMLEMSELINKIAEHYNFHDGMLSPSEGDGGGGDDGGDDGEGGGGGDAAAQTAFDVKLTGFDAKAKIKIIKEVRSLIPGLGLKEAKEMVESAPVSLQKGMSKENAEEIKKKLEALGAEIEIV